MKILITGGLGFIGTHLEKELIARGHEVIIFDRLRVNRDNYIRGDICDYLCVEEAFERTEPEIVVHLAAMVSRKESEETPYMAIQTNVAGTLNIVHLCRKYKARLIYAGSSEEYGSAFFSGKKLTEETPFGLPTSIYSMTKRMAEELIQYYAAEKGLVATTTRFFMLYGPGEPATNYRSALIRFIDAAIKGEDLIVHEGTKRQWCYISDAIEVLTTIIETRQKQNYAVYNIGNDTAEWTLDLAKRIIQMTKSKSQIRQIPVEDTVIPVKLADFSKARKELKWEAKTSLADGIMKVYAGYIGAKK
jgi:nucleoside-diphosphate-sugar epimerase